MWRMRWALTVGTPLASTSSALVQAMRKASSNSQAVGSSLPRRRKT